MVSICFNCVHCFGLEGTIETIEESDGWMRIKCKNCKRSEVFDSIVNPYAYRKVPINLR